MISWISDAHVYGTLSMVGLIWFIQIVHYPMMADVGAESFVEYERIHQTRTTWVVMPLMLTELATAAILLANLNTGSARGLAIAGIVLIAVIWATTFFVSVPMHTKLSQGFDTTAHHRLVSTNWIRTFCWSVRGVLAIMISRNL